MAPMVGFHSQIRMFIHLALGGFTSGERNGSAGHDLGFASEEDEGNLAIVWPSDT